MKTKDLDHKSDGETIGQHIREAPSRPGLEARRVNVDFPAWVVASLDEEAERLGITRQALIKVWIAERLKSEGRALP